MEYPRQQRCCLSNALVRLMNIINPTQPDVTLLMDMDGVIREVSFSNAVAEQANDGWLGRRWGDTVSGDGNDAVRRMIADANASGVSGFSQIMQRFPSGRELPFEYTTLMLGGKAGLIAVGKNLQAVTDLQSKLVAAQQVMERDYWKLREVETRYRLLFEASNEAVLLVRETNLRIVEANAAAIKALGLTKQGPESVVSREFLLDLDEADRATFQSLVARVRAQGKAPAIVLHLGEARKPWFVRASMVMSEPGPVLLLQLSPSGKALSVPRKPDPISSEAFIERLPDGFAVVDRDGKVLKVNRAFLDLVQAGTKNAIMGQPLSRWLRQPGADWGALFDNVTRYRSVRLFSTTISGELGTERRVEICAAGDIDDNPNHLGILLRDVERRLEASADDAAIGAVQEALEQKLGEIPLKSIIDEAIGAIERHCIVAALQKSDGNRKAASEILGLSRQTLYTKLSRYGLEKDLPNRRDDDV